MTEKNENLVCPICKEPTRVYMGNARKDRLCANHANKLKNNEIRQCEKCEKWHLSKDSCSCENTFEYKELPSEGFKKCLICETKTDGYAFCRSCWQRHTTEKMLEILNNYVKTSDNDKVEKEAGRQNPITEESDIIIDDANITNCITCKKETEGILFCVSCYRKYKNKDLLIKIKNCTMLEILDENYEGRYTCKDGHIVKSKSERDIDNYLFENEIFHAYEKELPYGPNEKDTLHPDFYLPNYLGKDKHVYIEHWGFDETATNYTKIKNFKMSIYQKLCDNKEITLVCTYEKTDIGKIDTVLARKLNKNFIKENQINSDEYN